MHRIAHALYLRHAPGVELGQLEGGVQGEACGVAGRCGVGRCERLGLRRLLRCCAALCTNYYLLPPLLPLHSPPSEKPAPMHAPGVTSWLSLSLVSSASR